MSASPSALLARTAAALPALDGLKVGVDLVSVASIADSLARFGDAFVARLYADEERAYACAAPALVHQRLAARFAAKEAAIKALDLGREGFDWREIVVERRDSGECALALRGRVAALAAARGRRPVAVSLGHDHDHAVAIVLVATDPILQEHRS